MSFRRVFSGAPWESRIGYCRALRAGSRIFVTGTAPVSEDGGVHAPGNAYAQARRCLEIIEAALEPLGANLSHVTRTRMFVTDIDQWVAFGRAHAEAFGASPPATTMVEVRRLIDPAMLIEIEADAVVGPEGADDKEA
ncbi:MAG: RidA family protein [Gemmatimonadota bacterium]